MSSVPSIALPNIDLSYQIPPQYYQSRDRILAIGSKINPIYASGQKWTPAQKKRAIAITCLVISVLITLSATLLAIATGSPIMLICSAVGLMGCCLSARSLALIKPDLDDPRRRNAEMVKIARLPVDKIIKTSATEYGLIDIVEYALLDRITGPKNPHFIGITGDARDIFYDKFAHLADSYNIIENQRRHHIANIQKVFNDTTAPLRQWRDDRMAEIQRLKQAGNAIQHISQRTESPRRHGGSSAHGTPYAVAGEGAQPGNRRSTIPSQYSVAGQGNRSAAVAPTPYKVAGQDSRRDRGNTAGKAVEVVGGLTNFAIQLGSQMTENQVNDAYQRAIDPLEQWKVSSTAQQANVYSGLLRLLNLTQKYQEIIQEFRNSNYQTQTSQHPGPQYQAPMPTPSAPPYQQ